MSGVRTTTPTALAAAIATRRGAAGAGRTLAAPARLWRRSLRVRAVLITLVLTSVALVAVGSVVTLTIGRSLFDDRRDQVLAESARATNAAQLSVSTSPFDQTSLDNARNTAIALVRTAARSDGLVWIDSSGTSTADGLDGPTSDGTENLDGLISNELSSSLSGASAGQQWQSVAITRGGQAHPGIVVGSVLQFGGGRAQLYLVYDLEDVQTTLLVVERALLIGAVVLLLLIAAVVTIVTGLITAPLRQAAATSEQLAAGRLDQRIPERGEDVVATLARSFNRMAESLQRQIVQLGNLSRVQQRFVSDVSHELRTPLTTIRLASDVLYDARARYDAPTARSAELLRTQVQRFEALLADLLEISRIDAHAAEVAAEPTNLVDVARETIDSLGGLADELGSSVHLVAPGGHAAVEVDGRRVARIVRNLLANALEHGEGRPVVVTVDSSAEAVAVGVRDHGIGMSEDEAARAFDRFWRADPSRRRRVGGTGLGLAISLEDALLHGGALEVWSRPGDGANFVLTLPRHDGAAPDRPVPVLPVDLGEQRAAVAAGSER